jgi:hypothetical protein
MGGRGWGRERWWFKLAQVCQRWRNVILKSPSYLDLCLVCTYGVPVADMLANSPPFPLIIDYPSTDRDITAEDEEGIILALEKRDRVRRIRLGMPVPNMKKLIMVIDEEYPVLEYLIMAPSTEDKSTVMKLPGTFQAPHLRHILLRAFALPIRSRLLATAVGIVTLCLYLDHPSAYFQPSTLHRWISVMPQLETLLINFLFPVPKRDVERQLMHMPHVVLPNLRWFEFQGVNAYTEAVVRRITTPRLEKLGIRFFNQLTFSVSRLLQFMNTTESLRFDSAKFKFSGERVYVGFYPHEAKMDALSIYIDSWHLDWQVSSVAQIFNSLSQIFSTVEHLTLEHVLHNRSSEEHNEVDRTEWRKLLRSFSNVKTLRIDDGLVKGLSCSLQLVDGEHSLELLPELQELTYSGNGDTGDPFTSFIDARKNAGRPVTLVHLLHTCLNCKRIFDRRQELKRHLRSNLPHWIHCPIPQCGWTGNRLHTLTDHMTAHPQGGGFAPEEYQIYNPEALVESMARGTLTVVSAADIALSMVEERFAQPDKVGVAANVWNRRRKFCKELT